MAQKFLENFLNVQFFGEFLIDRWIINRDQLLAALDYQMNRNERFGAIAVRKGFLTKAQVEDIKRRQCRSDLTFGELAISVGLLTHEQVKQIATYQHRNNLLLGQTLLRLNFIDEATLNRELTNYREHHRRFSGDEISIAVSPASAAIIHAGLDLTRKMFRRVAGIIIKAGCAVVITPEDEKTITSYPVTVSVGFSGDESIRFILSVSRSLALPIASSLLGVGDHDELDEMVLDAVKEFCNYICGNTAARVARKGVQVDISPPTHLTEIPDMPAGCQTVAYPMRSTGGGLDLRFHVNQRVVATRRATA